MSKSAPVLIHQSPMANVFKLLKIGQLIDSLLRTTFMFITGVRCLKHIKEMNNKNLAPRASPSNLSGKTITE
jgi:hypothetical protein